VYNARPRVLGKTHYSIRIARFFWLIVRILLIFLT